MRKILTIFNIAILTTANYGIVNAFKSPMPITATCCCINNSCYDVFSRGNVCLVHKAFQESLEEEINGRQIGESE